MKRFNYLTEQEATMPIEQSLLQLCLGLETCKTKEDVVELLKDAVKLGQARITDYLLDYWMYGTIKEALKEKINKITTKYTPEDYDKFICIGLIIGACGEEEDYPKHQDLLAQYESARATVSEELRKLKIFVGEVKLYFTTHAY